MSITFGLCWLLPCVKTQKVLLSTYPLFSLIPFHQLQEVFRLFDNANCPNLQNKPKMFFIQACRGGECPAGRAPGWRLLGSLPPALTFLFAPLRCYWIPWAPPSVHCCHRLSCSVSVPDACGVLDLGSPWLSGRSALCIAMPVLKTLF